MANQSLVAIPPDLSNQIVLRRVISSIVEQLDIIVGNKAVIDGSAYVEQKELIERAEQLQTEIKKATDSLDEIELTEGPPGPAGADGASAYQIWLDEGNTGTEQDFLDSLVGPEASLAALSVTKLADQQLPADISYHDITGWTSVQVDSDYSINSGTGEITINTTGLYMIQYNSCLDQYAGNNRTSSYCRLVLNGSLMAGTEQIGYHRQTLHGFNNYSASRIISLTATDVIKLQARNDSASLQQQVLASGTQINIMKIG